MAGIGRKTVDGILGKKEKLPNFLKFNFQDDYQIPLFIILIAFSTTIKTLSAAISALPLKTRLSAKCATSNVLIRL